MRKTGVAVLVLVCLALLGATVVFYSKYHKSTTAYAQMTASEAATRARYGEAINEIATIQDSLNAIVVGEEAAGALAARSKSEVEVPPSVRDQVLARIAMLKEGLERTKTRIQTLDTRLKKSGVRIAGLEKMITGLKSSVAEKEQVIAQLDTQVDSLQTQVAGLSADVQQKDQELTDKQHELATVYYTIGDKKELIKSGVVVSKGGVLGFGKTLKPSGDFNETVFTTLDTDQETTIEIPTHKAQVLSQQPISSYVIQQTGENSVELRIIDPKEFRKVKHLVILTT